MKRRILSLFIAIIGMLICQCSYLANGQEQGSKTEVVATINGNRVITSSEIDELIAPQVYSLQERIYSLRKNALDNLITKIVLEHEAKMRGVTVEQLKRELMSEKVEVKQSQIDEVYLENRGGLGSMPEDEAKQRIRLDLEGRERLEKYRSVLAELKTRAKIVVSLHEPIPPTIKVSAEGPSIGGPREAPVTIVEFSDFQCPFCKQVGETTKQVLQGYGDKVRLVFKHLPLSIHPDAFKAAQASVCAADQGKFWQYHDRLFNSSSLSTETLMSVAAAVGVNTKEFTTCLDSEESRARVSADMKEARLAEILSTPTFIINGRVLKGARGVEDFKRMINEELERHQKRQSVRDK